MLQVPLCVFMSALSICMAWLILTCATTAVRAFGLLWILRRRLVLQTQCCDHSYVHPDGRYAHCVIVTLLNIEPGLQLCNLYTCKAFSSAGLDHTRALMALYVIYTSCARLQIAIASQPPRIHTTVLDRHDWEDTARSQHQE